MMINQLVAVMIMRLPDSGYCVTALLLPDMNQRVGNFSQIHPPSWCARRLLRHVTLRWLRTCEKPFGRQFTGLASISGSRGLRQSVVTSAEPLDCVLDPLPLPFEVTNLAKNLLRLQPLHKVWRFDRALSPDQVDDLS